MADTTIIRAEEARLVALGWALTAQDATEKEVRALSLRLRDKWIDVANKCEFVGGRMAPAESPQGQTPPGMQAAPEGSSKRIV
jgi:hypothetical protein